MTCVGGDERAEFARQNALLGERWRGALRRRRRDARHAIISRSSDGLADAVERARSPGARALMKLDR